MNTKMHKLLQEKRTPANKKANNMANNQGTSWTAMQLQTWSTKNILGDTEREDMNTKLEVYTQKTMESGRARTNSSGTSTARRHEANEEKL